MERNEAIGVVRSFIDKLATEHKEALSSLLPELAESEDERIRKMLIDVYKRADMGGEIFGKGITYKQVIAYLEKQKEQKPAEWSEEDEEMIDYAYGLCYNAHETAHSAQDANKATKCMSWLKSLRPQPHWKPSEEQMEAYHAILLSNTLYYTKTQKELFVSLYNDLEKLM